MSDDLDRLLEESLRSVGDEYDRVKDPRRRAEARAEFLDRYEKRRWVFPFVAAVAATAVIVVIAVAVTALVNSPDEVVPRENEQGVAGDEGVVTKIPIDGEPVDVGARENFVFVADARDGELVRIDAHTGEILSSIAIGEDPRILSVGSGAIWLGDPSAGLVYQLDKTTGDPVREPLDVGPPAASMSISIGPEAVWVVQDGSLVKIDPDAGTVEPITSAPDPLDVAAQLGRVWVLDGQQGLLRLDRFSGEQIGSATSVQGFNGDVFAGADRIWVADRQDDTIISVDPETGRVLQIFRVQGTYLDLAFDDRALWVLSRGEGDSGLVTPLDLSSGEPLHDPVTVSGSPVEIATGSDAVWVALRGEGAVARIDPVALLESDR